MSKYFQPAETNFCQDCPDIPDLEEDAGQSDLTTWAAHTSTMGDMETAVCMLDHFDKIQKLPDPIPGCPNFRRVPGFKVYCCGQPTVEGFEKVLEKVTGNIYPKDGPIIW